MIPPTLFGTDGIRGLANQYPITPHAITSLAMATADHFMKNSLQGPKSHKFTVVIGKDTRLSGYMIESALVAGFIAMGANVILLGPVPTPAVSMLTPSLRSHLGVMISASHNPSHDNGLKFFNHTGLKISKKNEEEIEDLFHHFSKNPDQIPLIDPEGMGKARRLEDALGRYSEFAKSTMPKGLLLDGLKIVVDCAHGAAYKIAPQILWELGADVIAIGCDPDGHNINKDVGATSVRALQCEVLKQHADIGIALDGDADRLILVDERGQVIDGDQILARVASLLKDQGCLKGGGIVATHLSNLGLKRYLTSLGLNLYTSDVGDRWVLHMMQEMGCNLGGEQSGHIILRDHVTTGDGIIASLQVLTLLKERGLRASHISKTFEPVFQLNRNIKLSQKMCLSAYPDLNQKIKDMNDNLSDQGMILVRPSGTEPYLRVMVQGDNEKKMVEMIHEVCLAIREEKGLSSLFD